MQTREVGSALAQFNPARLVSTGAKIDKATLAKRPCFLCEKNRPGEQIVLPFGNDFDILVNPFPILPVHFYDTFSPSSTAGNSRELCTDTSLIEGLSAADGVL